MVKTWIVAVGLVVGLAIGWIGGHASSDAITPPQTHLSGIERVRCTQDLAWLASFIHASIPPQHIRDDVARILHADSDDELRAARDRLGETVWITIADYRIGEANFGQPHAWLDVAKTMQTPSVRDVTEACVGEQGRQLLPTWVR